MSGSLEVLMEERQKVVIFNKISNDHKDRIFALALIKCYIVTKFDMVSVGYYYKLMIDNCYKIA